VAVISGPIYAPDPSLPAPANQIIYTAEKNHVRIPIPTHFFKVIIGRLDGKVAAVGFLIPHVATVAPSQLDRYVVPIRRIEEVTHLNFMPALGANDAMEKKPDGRWLPLVR
jgi:DNA/RNA endonuclease G (NUC1)